MPVVKPPPHSPGEGRPQNVHGSFGCIAIDELWTEGNTAAINNLCCKKIICVHIQNWFSVAKTGL